MNEIGAAEAREHVAMIDRILAQSHQRLCAGGEYFLVWGIGSAYVTIASELVVTGVASKAFLWSTLAVLLACILFSILRSRLDGPPPSSTSLVQREFFNVLWITVALAVLVDVAAFRIFPGLAGAGIWSVAESIVLFYIGLHGNRRAQVCGVAIVASLVVANFVGHQVAGYVLGAGMLVGYGGFGLSELLLARD
jgi:hypothetical protein